MATIKSYTDLEQSKKLTEILPLESADNVIVSIGDREGVKTITMPKETLNILRTPFADIRNTIPCWSLAALLEQLPYEVVDDNGNSMYLRMYKEDDVYQLVYEDPYGDFESIETDRYEHFVDACVELILKLNELNLL